MRYMVWLTFCKLTHPVWYRLETYFRHPKIIILSQRITYFHLQIHMLEKRWLVSRVLEYQGRSVWPQVRFLRTYFKVWLSCQKSLPWYFGIDGRFLNCWWNAKAFSIIFSIKETVYFTCRKCNALTTWTLSEKPANWDFRLLTVAIFWPNWVKFRLTQKTGFFLN